MTKFIFKSNASDLQKISQSIETLQKNVLYITYRVDTMLKMLKDSHTDKALQTQVDDYFKSDYEEECQDSGPDKKDLDWLSLQ